MTYKIAIVGATSLIGQEIINILAENNNPDWTLTALTSSKMAGREISYGDDVLKTQNMDGYDYGQSDIVVVADYPREAEFIVRQALSQNIKVIDCTGITLFNQDHDLLTSLPSSTTLQLVKTLSSLHKAATIKRAVVSTYQAASTQGKAGMDELFDQSRKFFVSDGIENTVFAKQLAFNVIPQVGNFMDDGQTQAEWGIAAEIKKCLDKNIRLSATCVTTPVFIGTGIAVNVEFNNDMDVKTAKSIWRESEDVIIIDETSEMEFVTPAEIAGEDSVFVSRLRNDSTLDNGISFWCAGDNVRLMALHAVNHISS